MHQGTKSGFKNAQFFFFQNAKTINLKWALLILSESALLGKTLFVVAGQWIVLKEVVLLFYKSFLLLMAHLAVVPFLHLDTEWRFRNLKHASVSRTIKKECPHKFLFSSNFLKWVDKRP